MKANDYYPEKLARREALWIRARRAPQNQREDLAKQAAGEAEIRDQPAELPPNVAGLALSGGGIRSATFCLGVLEALAEKGWLRRLDFLSTVSGGGYAGSFLGAWISRPGNTIESVETELKSRTSPQVGFLRENGRFLAPNGAGDAWGAAVAHVRSWLSIVVVVGSFIVAAFLLGETAKLLLNKYHGWGTSTPLTVSFLAHPIALSPFWRFVNWALWLGALPVAIGYWLVAAQRDRPPLAYWIMPLALGYFAFAPLFSNFVPDFILHRRWPWIALALLVLEWCWWADLRQQRRSKTGRHWLRHAVQAVNLATFWAILFVAAAKWLAPEQWPKLHQQVTKRAMVFLLLVAALRALRWGALKIAAIEKKASAQPAAGASDAAATTTGADDAQPGFWRRAASGVRNAAATLHENTLIDEADLGAARSSLTSWLAWLLACTAVLAGLALIDSVALTLVAKRESLAPWSWSILSPTALVAALQSLIPKLLAKDEASAEPPGFLLGAGLWVAAAIAVALALIGPALGARLWAENLWGEHQDAILHGHFVSIAALKVGAAALGMFVVSGVLGRSLKFVNLSSHHNLYSARLTRTYLGASNPRRQGTASASQKTQRNWQVTETVPDDQVEYGDYRPPAHGGPLHLINVTINETISGLSNVEQRDRKGLSFAIGPAGLSVRRTDHALFAGGTAFAAPRLAKLEPDNSARRFHALSYETRRPQIDVELPPVGAWVGMSGAAFTTGLGARTSLSKSVLLGMLNVRLGYWWDSYIPPYRRYGVARRSRAQRTADYLAALFPAQVAFADEMLARFHGFGRRQWYLSDGGHFENTACYELIRRRLRFILCCDCGCDAAYDFEDVANLVRKARIDFQTEIRFLERDELVALGDQSVIGPLSALRPQPDTAQGQRLSTAHAALAVVNYPDGTQGHLLLIKPTLRVGLPRDVLHYAAENPPFPQQTTMDQFFDEAQWESYRELGLQIGRAVFAVEKLKPTGNEPGWKTSLPAFPDPAGTAATGGHDKVLEQLVDLFVRVREQYGAGEKPKAG